VSSCSSRSRPDLWDLSAVESTWAATQDEAKPAWIVLNACSPTATGAVEEAVNTISNTQMKLAPAKVHSRIAFTYCKTEGGSVLEYDPQGKAAEETRELFYWVCRQIGLRVRRERVE
jgi:chromosome partitioning protein